MFAGGLLRREHARKWIVIGLTGAVPIALLAVHPEPLAYLKIAGAIEAAQIPLVAGSVLWWNRRNLPPELRPKLFASIGGSAAVLFFSAFAVAYFLT